MRWQLDDQITHETVTLRGRGEWRIGREIDPAETTKFFSFYQSMGTDAPIQNKILVPITADFDKFKKVLTSFVLSKVSREHAIFGIDESGPYIVDISTNGTTVRDGQGYKVCEKGAKCRLAHGMIVYLAANYPLQVRRQSAWRDFFKAIKTLFTNFLPLESEPWADTKTEAPDEPARGAVDDTNR